MNSLANSPARFRLIHGKLKTRKNETSRGWSSVCLGYGISVDMSETFQLGDWEVNTSLNSLSRDNTSVHLEPKMMDVLAYLSAHAGEVISTEQLLIEFWQGTFYGDAPVQKCIAMLRKKLGDNSRQPSYIETVQRRGYRIIANVVLLDERQRWGNLQKLSQWTQGSPYRGLQTFQPEHAAIFFGRNKAIAEVVHHLNQAMDDNFSFLLLMGKSGSGKSSLLRAGVIPFITRSEGLAGIKVQHYTVITPTRGKASSIFRQLLGALNDMSMLVDTWNLDAHACDLSQHPSHLKALLKESESITELNDGATSTHSVARPHNLIVIDQFEQVLQDASLSKEDAASLMSFLTVLVKTQRLILIVSLRNDFYANSMELEGFARLKDEGQQYDLQPPNATDIARMIRLPALSAGLSFEENVQTGEKLDEVLLEAAIGHPDALPLMEFTLDLLYQRRDKENTLLFSAFANIGGLEGAIAQQAETTYQGMSETAKASWKSVMHELVTINDVNQTGLIARKVPIEQFSDENDLAFIQQFVDARLFVTESDLGANELTYNTSAPDAKRNKRVCVAHEALLKHWDRITDWAQKNRAALLKRTELNTDCSRWLNAGKPQDMLLPSGRKLDDARWMAKQPHLHLTPQETLFIHLSEGQHKKTQRYKTSAIAALAILAVSTTGLAIYSNNQTQLAVEQTHQAQVLRNKAESLVDYMLGDLRSQLEPIGKLDVLEGVGQKTLDYYAGIETGDGLRQANSLKLLAEININRGEFEHAGEQLSQALNILNKQDAEQLKIQETAPNGIASANAYSQSTTQTSEQVLFLKGNIHYWIGVIAYFKQDYTTTIEEWTKYLNYSQQLLVLDELNPKWMLEVSSAQHNIGSLALRISQYESASQNFRDSIALKRKMLISQPNHSEVQASLRGSLLGLVAVAFQTFEFNEAEKLAEEAYTLAVKLLLENPDDYNIVYQTLSSANLLIQAQMSVGNKSGADKTITDGVMLAQKLAKQEPENEAWMTKVATLMFFYWDYHLLFDTTDSPPNPALLNLTRAAFNKTKNLPIKQKIYSVKLGFENRENSEVMTDIAQPSLEFNSESTPRLLWELHLKCRNHPCTIGEDIRKEVGKGERKSLALTHFTLANTEKPSNDMNASLTEFYFLLVSSKRSAARDVLLSLEKQGYLHPQLTDAINRAKDDT
jgi:DNA-binding winged helix-turn-helix (wHTH) protein/tetratricopeptide (TPR) repeat protein